MVASQLNHKIILLLKRPLTHYWTSPLMLHVTCESVAVTFWYDNILWKVYDLNRPYFYTLYSFLPFSIHLLPTFDPTMAFTWLSEVVVIRNLECIHIIVWYFVFISHSHYCFMPKRFEQTSMYIFSAEVEYVQLVLNWRNVHVIWMSDRWPPCILPDGSSPVIRTLYWVDVHNGEKGSCTRWLSYDTMVHPSFC